MRKITGLIILIFMCLANSISAEEIIKKLAVDLNGDGKIDNIKCVFPEEYGNSYELTINDKSVEGEGENLNGTIDVVDIDKYDGYKELAISQSGPSDDFATTYYAYDGINIINMGMLEGDKDILIDGLGKILEPTRNETLITWFVYVPYCLNLKHEFQEIPEKIHYAVYPHKVKVIKAFKLKKVNNSSAAEIALNPGEVINLIGLADNGWILVKTSNESEGWFQVEYEMVPGTKERYSDYLEGLAHAD